MSLGDDHWVQLFKLPQIPHRASTDMPLRSYLPPIILQKSSIIALNIIWIWHRSSEINAFHATGCTIISGPRARTVTSSSALWPGCGVPGCLVRCIRRPREYWAGQTWWGLPPNGGECHSSTRLTRQRDQLGTVFSSLGTRWVWDSYNTSCSAGIRGLHLRVIILTLRFCLIDNEKVSF